MVESTRAHIWAEASRGIPIVTAGLGTDAGIIGAAAACSRLGSHVAEGNRVRSTIVRLMQEEAPVLGDGGYLIELERRGYVDSGSGREKVGTGRGSGQFTPEVVVENPDALRELHREFLRRRLSSAPGPDVLRHAREAVAGRLRKADRGNQRGGGPPRERGRGREGAGRRLRVSHAALRARRSRSPPVTSAICSTSRFGSCTTPAWTS